MNHHDVVIIGGGISGTAAAYELARSGANVTLLEKGTLASMASGWTLAGVRQSGRDPAELPLAKAAVQRWQTLGEELGADLEYRQNGNLRLARTPDEVPVIRHMVDEQRALGLDLTFLPDNASIKQVAPAISEHVLAASFCPTDGHANPLAVVTAFARAAERYGATIRTGVTVTAIDTSNDAVRGVQTSEGPISADAVVVTAGIFSGELCAPLGIDLPIHVAHVTAIQSVPLEPVIDQVIGVANGDFAGRQQADGRFRFTGSADEWTGGAFTPDAIQPPAAMVAEVIQRGIGVLPAIASTGIARVWGGLLDMTPDALPIIEQPDDIAGLVIAAGFSGHGFCLGPVTGQIIRELVERGESALPLGPFQRERFKRQVGEAAPTLHG